VTIGLHSIPGKCDKNAILFLKLIKNSDEIILDKQIDLLKDGEPQPGLEWEVVTGLPRGTVLELCVEPRSVVCEGVGVRMVVNRHGPSRKRSEAG
jgi:hypothetical protein